MTATNAFNPPAAPQGTTTRSPQELTQLIADEIEKQNHGFSAPDPKKIRAFIEQGALLSAYPKNSNENLIAIIKREGDVVKEIEDMPQYRGQILVALAATVPQATKEVKALLKGGNIDFSQTDEQGRTALMLAARTGFRDIVKMVAAADDNLFRLDNHGWNALMHAAWSANNDLVQFFIDKKLPVAYRTPSNYSAIDLALVGEDEDQGKWLSAARFDLTVLLARNGADVERPNEKGISPVAYLKLNEMERFIPELREAAAQYRKELMDNVANLKRDVEAPAAASFRKLPKP